MFNEQYLEEFHQRYEQREKRIQSLSRYLVWVALSVAALLGAITFASLFSVSIFLMLAVFVAGIIVDAQIYLEKLPKFMHMILMRHPFMGIEAEHVLRCLRVPEKEGETSKLDGLGILEKDHKNYLDRWLLLRREYFKDRNNRRKNEFDFLSKLRRLAEVSNKSHPNFIQFAVLCQEQLIKIRDKSDNGLSQQQLTGSEEIKKDEEKLRALRKTLQIKKTLAVVGVPLALSAGLGMSAIAYNSMFALFSLLGVSVAAFPPVWIALAAATAVVAGMFWTITMYKTFYSAVKSNIFKKLREKLEFKWDVYDKKQSTSEKALMIAQASLQYVITAAVAALGVIAIVASCGAYGSAILEAFSFIPPACVFIIGLAILPVRALFAIKHAAGAVHKIGKSIEKGYHYLSKKTMKQHLKDFLDWFRRDFLKAPVRNLCIGLFGTVLFLATLLHVLAEAALDMGGNSDNTFWQKLLNHSHLSYRVVGQVIQRISAALHLTAQQFVVLIQSMIEFLEHIDFAYKQAPVMLKGCLYSAEDPVGVKVEEIQKLEPSSKKEGSDSDVTKPTLNSSSEFDGSVESQPYQDLALR